MTITIYVILEKCRYTGEYTRLHTLISYLLLIIQLMNLHTTMSILWMLNQRMTPRFQLHLTT